MSTQVGRVSGPLLKENLLRNGIDLAFETDLLYLDVNNQKIGIKTSSPTRDLLIETEVQTTNLIVDTLATINSSITIDSGSNISTFFNDLTITATNVTATHFGVGDFDIDDNRITQTASNADFEIRPTGSGIFKVVNDFTVYGSLHSTGNVTLDGNIVFGSGADDNVVFSSDVDSNLIPNLDLTYSLGSNYQKWNSIYADYLNGQIIQTDQILYGSGTQPATRQGNIWYVAINGTYSNVGDHPNGPFGSLEKALSVATSGDTVYIYPGTYYELFPLTIPAGVTVAGTDIRNTIIVPDTASEFEDVFLLNDGCTIQDLTIKNFYFDSINNKGYAFRFAPNIQITNRSPYIQNCSVITRGTVTSPSDPLGFLTGDAGKGAYIDGSVANSSTNEASMLFHSATFITPGVDTITMLNGVRVEWLDSFTYYANRGLYALQGVNGLANLSLQYGAEVRSINSANVYGNYGAVADGANTLMYLINHNFAYIGTGYDTSNDPTLVIQANETVELNSGKIYYTSFDHAGAFRVGDTFWVDLKNGTTSIDVSSINADSLVGIRFVDGDQITFIDYSKIETGNLQIAGNTIRSLNGSVDITSASGEINLDQDVFVSKNLAISNNFSIAGQLNLGNAITDVVRFDAEIDDNLDPKANVTYNIGSPSRNWKNLYTRNAEISDIEINTNYIRTTVSNADLELRTSGNGTVLVEDIRVQQRTVSIDTGNIQINPATTLDITASTTNINGKFHVTNNVYLDSNITLGNANNDIVIYKARVNSDIVPQIDNNYALGDSLRSWNLYTGKILLDDIEINDNYIRTTASNLNLELKASGIGAVRVEKVDFNENIILTNGSTNLRIEPATTLDITASTTNITGQLHVTNHVVFDNNTTLGNASNDIVTFNARVNTDIIPQISSFYTLGDSLRGWNLYTGKILLDDIEINDNYIRTTASNLNLELKASGIGAVRVEKVDFNENVIKTNGTTNLRIEPATTLDITASTTNINGILHVTNHVLFDSNTTFGNATSDKVIFSARVNTDIIPQINASYKLGDSQRAWNLHTGMILLDDIEINDNYIRTTASNLNLELKANGIGAVRVEKVDFNENVIKTNGTTNLRIEPATTLDIYATTTTVNANVDITGDFTWGGTITVGNADTDNISFVSDINSDLLPDLADTYNLGSLAKRWNTLWVNNAFVGNIEINTNYIQTTSGNLDLILRGNSNGGVLLENTRFRNNTIESSITNQNIQIDLTGSSILDTSTNTALRIPRGTSANRPVANMQFGEIRFNTTDNLFGGFTTARTAFGGVYSADRLTYARAEPLSNVLTFSTQGITTLDVNPTRFNVSGLLIDDITVNNNTMSTINTDLILDPYASNTLDIDSIQFDDNLITNKSNNAITIAHTTGQGYLKFDGSIGIRIPAGDNSERPSYTPEQGTTRWNTDQDYLEIFIGTSWQLATATAGSAFASEAEVKEIGYLWSLILA